jgi:hypothetical protein
VYTDPIPALVGLCLLLAGYPLYLVMRRIYPEQKEPVVPGEI